MNRATRRVLGRDVALSHNYLGLNQIEAKYLDDYVEARRLERSEGYKSRKREFEERMLYLSDKELVGG